MQDRIEAGFEVFVQTGLEALKIDRIAARGESFGQAVEFEHLREGFPTGIFAPLVVGFKGSNQDFQSLSRELRSLGYSLVGSSTTCLIFLRFHVYVM